MAATTLSADPSPYPSAWAVGGLVFAAAMMVMGGIFQALAGLVAIADEEFFVVVGRYTYDLDVTTWGWIHLVVGAVVAVAGGFLLSRRLWAAVIAIAVSMVSAITNFFFIPYYPVWAVVIIAFDVFVIWALTRPGIIDVSR
jgi:hypothetical protein